MESTGENQKKIMRGWNQRNLHYWKDLKTKQLGEVWGYQEFVDSMAETIASIIALRQENEKLTKRIIKLEKRSLKSK